MSGALAFRSARAGAGHADRGRSPSATAPVRLSLVPTTRIDPSTEVPEKSFRFGGEFEGLLAPEAAERRWFAGLLWQACPGAPSERDLAEMVAARLAEAGRPVTPRAVRNWLREANTPHYRYVLAVIALAGAARPRIAAVPAQAGRP